MPIFSLSYSILGGIWAGSLRVNPLFLRKSKKDEPLANLKHFMIEQERFTGCKLKVRRSDRGGEFLSKDFVCLVPTPAEL